MRLEPGFDAAHAPRQGARHNALRALATHLLDDLVTTFFPADCRCCASPLHRASTVPVCAACIAALAPSHIPACPRCGDGVDFDLAYEDLSTLTPQALLCRECRLAPPPFTRAVAYGLYETQLRELIRLLKFEHVPAVASLLAPHLAQAVLTLQPEAAPALLVTAVPLFRQRQRQRGYNQSLLLAGAALRHIRRVRPAWRLTPAHTILTRQRSTESSFVLTRRDRRRNLRGAFALAPAAEALIHSREILLIDDILTSGATARECARVLIRAGAAKVWVATLARAQKRSVLDIHQAATSETAAWDLAVPSPNPSPHPGSSED